MSVDDLMVELSRLSVKITVNGDKLHIDAPAGALTPGLREALVEHKVLLLRQLSEPAWSQAMACQPLRIPLTLEQSPSAWLAERGLRIVGGDHHGLLYVAPLPQGEGAA